MRERPHRRNKTEITAIEPLVQAVYDKLYGPTRWQSKSPDTRAGITQFVIDTARSGARDCIVHRTPNGGEHTIPATTVLNLINTTQKGS